LVAAFAGFIDTTIDSTANRQHSSKAEDVIFFGLTWQLDRFSA